MPEFDVSLRTEYVDVAVGMRVVVSGEGLGGEAYVPTPETFDATVWDALASGPSHLVTRALGRNAIGEER